MSFPRSALLWLIVTATAVGQEELSVLPTNFDPPPRKMLKSYLLTQAGQQFDARREQIAALKTRQDVAVRQEALRSKFLAALGGLPERTPLNPVVVGRVPGDGYTIEKVIYESRPRHHVTASLYLPEGKGPFPGVIMPIGHSNNGKAAEYIQRGSALLARQGIAVLAYDPIGQGERRQLLDADGKQLISSSTTEHTLTSVGALLVGRCTASYRVWDGIRSLDYLASRPEIDATRLGCTGCSGGGTMTSYLMALDSRIVAAAPSCYLTSLERLFATIGPQDGEQNIPGQVAFGMEHADYILMHAPQPTLICAATQDFFDQQGTRTTYAEAQGVLALLGKPQHVTMFESESKHGFPRPQREAVAQFMKQHLLGRNETVAEHDWPLLKDVDLQCTPRGQVLAEFKGRSVFDLNLECAEELAKQRAASKRPPADILSDVRRLLAVPSIPSVKLEELDKLDRDGYQIQKVIYTTEPGIRVPGLWFVPPEAKGPVVLYLHGGGKEVAAARGGPLEKLARQGRRVLALDVRGMGETAPSASTKRSTFGTEYTESFLAMHLNRPLLGQRVYDVLAVLGELNRESFENVELWGVGAGGLVALHAAALDARVKAVTLEETLESWMDIVRTPQNTEQLAQVVPGALEAYDLPELAAAIGPRKLTVLRPVDAVGAVK